MKPLKKELQKAVRFGIKSAADIIEQREEMGTYWPPDGVIEEWGREMGVKVDLTLESFLRKFGQAVLRVVRFDLTQCAENAVVGVPSSTFEEAPPKGGDA